MVGAGEIVCVGMDVAGNEHTDKGLGRNKNGAGVGGRTKGMGEGGRARVACEVRGEGGGGGGGERKGEGEREREREGEGGRGPDDWTGFNCVSSKDALRRTPGVGTLSGEVARYLYESLKAPAQVRQNASRRAARPQTVDGACAPAQND